MKKLSNVTNFSVITSLFLGLFTFALADTSNTQSSPPAFQSLSERVEAALQKIHAVLRITPMQESAWINYAGVRLQGAKEMEKKLAELKQSAMSGNRQASADANLTPIDVLQQQRDRIADMTAHLDTLIAATKQLYAVLTPDQQMIANQVLMPHQPTIVATPARPLAHQRQ